MPPVDFFDHVASFLLTELTPWIELKLVLERRYHDHKTMSTGTPVSSVDVNPPASNSAGHGHSRSRGHSRSTRYGQVPNPIAVPSGLAPVQPHSPQPVVGTAYSNGHASRPAWHGHHHTHSQSSVHYDPWTPSPVTTVFEDHGMEPDRKPDTPPLLIEPETSRG